MSTENWKFSYAGIDLPPPDSGGMSLTLQPIDDAERNANGDLIIQPITLKRTIPVSWSNLNGETVHKIMSALTANRTGILTYFDVEENSVVERDVYWGANNKIDYIHYDDELKKQRYSSYSVNFIML